jgi:Family of unknown function (DUF6504)
VSLHRHRRHASPACARHVERPVRPVYSRSVRTHVRTLDGSRARSEAVTVGDLDPALPWTAVREDAARGSAALPGSSIGAVVEQAVNHEGGEIMTRRYGDPVEVRPAMGAGRPEGCGQPDPQIPGSFLWRGRLYIVRSVLGHWRERRSWWTTSAAGAVHGETAEQGPSGTPSGRSSILGEEREVWRVEASPGRSFVAGVYDLCRDPDPRVAGSPGPADRVAGSPGPAETVGRRPTPAVPTGSVPTGSVPTGSVPTGSVPTGSVPTGSVPTGSVPTGSVSTGSWCLLRVAD